MARDGFGIVVMRTGGIRTYGRHVDDGDADRDDLVALARTESTCA